MSIINIWLKSEPIAAIALLVAIASLVLQYYERKLPYKVQAYIDKGQAASNIIESVEKLINTRQIAMISVEGNLYEPKWAMIQPLERLNSDAREAAPVVIAFGNYTSAIQNGLRYFHRKSTLTALAGLDWQVSLAIKCFTDVASLRNKVNRQQLQEMQLAIASACEGANQPTSLDALKAAEAAAMSEMDAEREADAH